MTLNAHRSASAPTFALMLLALSGCTSTFDTLPEKMGGLPESAPARPAQSFAFPNVYEARPRETKPLSTDEQKKLESDLVTLREQQKNLANPPPPPLPPPPPPTAAKPPSKTPAKAAAPKKEPTKTAEKKKKEPVVPESGPAPLKPLN
jgi:hypothetical protein